MVTNATGENMDKADGAVRPKKKWTWSNLATKADIPIAALILRYLASLQSGGYTREELREMGNIASVEEISQMLYGRRPRTARQAVLNIADRLNTTEEELSLAAKAWAESGKPEVDVHVTIPLKGAENNRGYFFRRLWIQSLGCKQENLFALKVRDSLLASSGLSEGDILLIDSMDKGFYPGGFFAVACAGSMRVMRAVVRQNMQYLYVDVEGLIVAPQLFSDSEVLGRAIWRGTLLR